MSQEDTHFLKTFASVVGGLLVFSILLGTIAAMLQQQLSQEVSEARLAAVDERIEPIGAVHTGAEGEQTTPQAEDAAPGSQESEPAPETQDGEPEAQAEEAAGESAEQAMSGEQVYQQACSACHGTGAGGAPRLTREAWADRIEKGTDTLYQHSIEGFQGDSGFMPAKGGRADLSDQEVKNAVDHMLSQVEGG